LLPDDQIADDVAAVLKEIEGEPIELGEQHISVPSDSVCAVVSKMLEGSRYQTVCRRRFIVTTALGGICSSKDGKPRAKYCFAVLYYNDTGKYVTVDFEAECPTTFFRRVRFW